MRPSIRRERSSMMARMPRSNFARFAYTTRATACEMASTEYGWRTLTNSRMTSASPRM